MPSQHLSENFLRNLVEAAPDAMLAVNQSGRIVLVNKQAEELFGYPRAEILEQPIEILIPTRFTDKHVNDRDKYLRTPSLRPMGSGRNLAARRKDGREVAVDIMLNPAKDDRETFIIATVRDATGRRLDEQRLVSSEAMFRALYDQAPDAIIAVNKSGRIVQANRKTEQYFGYTADELKDQPVERIIPERYRKAHVAQRNGYIAEPHTRPMGAGLELFARRNDGSEFPVDIMLSPVATPGNEIVICVIRDVTDRKKAEKELKARADQLARSNEELERFAYVASHDLQEPLRSVAASCQVLQKRLAGKFDEDTNEYIQFAIDGAKRMQELINDLLSFSRATRGDQELKAIDLNLVMQRVLKNLEAQVRDCQARIDLPSLPTVIGDFSQLAQLFQNLISNAMKFRDKKIPEVAITLQEAPKHWTFCVKDNGIGIPKEYQHKIFILFQRLHRREEYPGTGIGLAICKKIVERHGGTIWLESVSGEGSRFYFTLPKKEDFHAPH